jgi:hypothetical protein
MDRKAVKALLDRIEKEAGSTAEPPEWAFMPEEDWIALGGLAAEVEALPAAGGVDAGGKGELYRR